MIEKISQDVKDLLDELNKLGKSIVFGGYLRDLYLNRVPSDVDIATNASIEDIEKKYSHMEKASKRKTISGHDVFSFKLEKNEKIFVEIVFTNRDVYEKSKEADYTINSLMFDGKELIDNQGFFKDVERKMINEVDIKIINEDLKTRPYLWLKTIRLISMTGFTLSENVFAALMENKTVIDGVSSEIFQTEGHKTLSGKGVAIAINYLSLLGFIKHYSFSQTHENQFSKNIQVHQKLLLISILFGKNISDDFSSLYHISSIIVDKHNELFNAYYSTEKISNKLKNQIITIKKIINSKEERED